MTNEDSQNTAWPLPTFAFRVKWDGNEFHFSEVTGMETETPVIEYRHGNSPAFSTMKMPGIRKFGNVTMKRGIFKGDHQFWNTYSQVKMNTYKRSVVTISLLDENKAVIMNWTLANAFPVKISAPDLKSDGNEIAIESIEFAHEGLTIEKQEKQ